MLKTFTIIIHKDNDVGGYWAECPALKGCNTQGDTIDEVKANMKEAIELCLEDYSNTIEEVFSDTITLEVANA